MAGSRLAEWVVEYVIDGFVNIEAALDLYCVAVRIVDEDAALCDVDEAETLWLRKVGPKQ